jgi:hypothetical protein
MLDAPVAGPLDDFSLVKRPAGLKAMISVDISRACLPLFGGPCALSGRPLAGHYFIHR